MNNGNHTLIPCTGVSHSFSDGSFISKNDLCAECSNCTTSINDLSDCSIKTHEGWPGILDAQGYITTCMSFSLSQYSSRCKKIKAKDILVELTDL